MTTDKQYRTVESPAGVGEVWRGQDRLATVSYLLDVHQEIPGADMLLQDDGIGGLKYMTGSISVFEGNKYLGRLDTLVLHLQDGRKVSFIVKDGDVAAGSFRIQPSGDFYR